MPTTQVRDSGIKACELAVRAASPMSCGAAAPSSAGGAAALVASARRGKTVAAASSRDGSPESGASAP
eukprot:6180143-Pleurochrysis_carterae.AAC.2